MTNSPLPEGGGLRSITVQETKISNFIKEVEFIDKNKTTNNLSFLLSKYNNFPD